MSDSICMIIREAPYGTIQAAEAARHIINGAIAGGLKTTVVLIEDGVYLAKEDQQAKDAGWTSLSEVLKQTLQGKRSDLVKFYVHDESALYRNINTADLMGGFEMAGGTDIAEIVAGAKKVMLF